MFSAFHGFTYDFLGHPRLGLPMLSPNILASYLALLFPLFLWCEHAWAASCAKTKKTGWPVRLGVAAMTAIGTIWLVLLAVTYGRAGFLGCLVALVLCIFVNWRLGIKYLLIFMVVMWMTPAGFRRVGTMAEGNDPAVVHRFQMWKDGLVAVADTWRGGFAGNPQNKDAFRIYYRDRHLHHTYSKTDNTFISDAMQKGISVYFMECLAKMLIMVAMFALGFRRRNAFAWMIGSCMAVYFFCCLWGDMANGLLEKNILFALFTGGCIVCWHEWRRCRPRIKCVCAVALSAMVANCVLVAAIGIAAWHFATKRIYHREAREMLTPHQRHGEMLVPERPENDTLVICVSSHVREDIPNRLREFCETGTSVYCMEMAPGVTSSEIREAVEAVMESQPKFHEFVLVSGGRNVTNLCMKAHLENMNIRQFVFIYPVFDHVLEEYRVEAADFSGNPSIVMVLPENSIQNPTPLPENCRLCNEPDGILLREITGL